jgi:hypothetical protein
VTGLIVLQKTIDLYFYTLVLIMLTSIRKSISIATRKATSTRIHVSLLAVKGNEAKQAYGNKLI